ncbi:hypothetical protein MPTK1_5g18000 [Marchantia polymorpha subsp. ruderalis]|uniref:Spt5 KOW domain-containing protein n=2 Tax=Marchantia polymorpha TaxID=3197 RepID=A0AAF6BJJ1_MARPO|nr:hypothetical protein MARPO_0084s0047 [Marchantia polymorpha]BBN12175.1 hypothetical protein Mp_5g18000 [Marchantia polymorpha subsp. ruderalis]|eukprot:PTQ33961.1 hypothetical protein MARPO_0084s0047 [Marchantia polymorpha]
MDDISSHLHQVMNGYDFAPSTAAPSSSWVLPNLMVQVGREGLGAFPGIVREVMLEGTCLVALAESTRGEHVMASESDLTMIEPDVSDDVKIVSGAYRHKTGKLVEKVGSQGLVLLADGFGLRYIDMKSIGKLEFVSHTFISEYESSTDEKYAAQREGGHVRGSNVGRRKQGEHTYNDDNDADDADSNERRQDVEPTRSEEDHQLKVHIDVHEEDERDNEPSRIEDDQQDSTADAATEDHKEAFVSATAEEEQLRKVDVDVPEEERRSDHETATMEEDYQAKIDVHVPEEHSRDNDKSTKIGDEQRGRIADDAPTEDSRNKEPTKNENDEPDKTEEGKHDAELPEQADVLIIGIVDAINNQECVCFTDET